MQPSLNLGGMSTSSREELAVLEKEILSSSSRPAEKPPASPAETIETYKTDGDGLSSKGSSSGSLDEGYLKWQFLDCWEQHKVPYLMQVMGSVSYDLFRNKESNRAFSEAVIQIFSCAKQAAETCYDEQGAFDRGKFVSKLQKFHLDVCQVFTAHPNNMIPDGLFDKLESIKRDDDPNTVLVKLNGYEVSKEKLSHAKEIESFEDYTLSPLLESHSKFIEVQKKIMRFAYLLGCLACDDSLKEQGFDFSANQPLKMFVSFFKSQDKTLNLEGLDLEESLFYQAYYPLKSAIDAKTGLGEERFHLKLEKPFSMLQFRVWQGGDNDGNPQAESTYLYAKVKGIETEFSYLNSLVDKLVEDKVSPHSLLQDFKQVLLDQLKTIDVNKLKSIDIFKQESLDDYLTKIKSLEFYFLKFKQVLLSFSRNFKEAIKEQKVTTNEAIALGPHVFTMRNNQHQLKKDVFALEHYLSAQLTNKNTVHKIDIRQDQGVINRLKARLDDYKNRGIKEPDAMLEQLDQEWQGLEEALKQDNKNKKLLADQKELKAQRALFTRLYAQSKLDPEGEQGAQSLIISNCSSSKALLNAYSIIETVYSKEQHPFDVIPLFETPNDLRHIDLFFDDLLSKESFVQRLKEKTCLRKEKTCLRVMIAHSDNRREAGLGGDYEVYKTTAELEDKLQEKLNKLEGLENVVISIFEGTGGGGRGGGHPDSIRYLFGSKKQIERTWQGGETKGPDGIGKVLWSSIAEHALRQREELDPTLRHTEEMRAIEEDSKFQNVTALIFRGLESRYRTFTATDPVFSKAFVPDFKGLLETSARISSRSGSQEPLYKDKRAIGINKAFRFQHLYLTQWFGLGTMYELMTSLDTLKDSFKQHCQTFLEREAAYTFENFIAFLKVKNGFSEDQLNHIKAFIKDENDFNMLMSLDYSAWAKQFSKTFYGQERLPILMLESLSHVDLSEDSIIQKRINEIAETQEKEEAQIRLDQMRVEWQKTKQFMQDVLGISVEEELERIKADSTLQAQKKIEANFMTNYDNWKKECDPEKKVQYQKIGHILAAVVARTYWGHHA